MSSEVPHDWPLVALGSLARVKRGASPRPIQDPKWFSGEGHGWVRISDVTASDRVLLQTTQYLSDAGRAASVEIVPGDLIMSICATIGRPLFSGIHACIHDGFVAFKKIDRSRLDPTYLYFVLQGLTLHFEAQSQPGTQRNLNSSLVGTTEIPLPPLDEQRRIAEVLRSVDETIAATQAVYAAATAAQVSAFETFLQSGNDIPGIAPVTGWTTGKIDGVRRLPAGWQIVKLVDVARLESGHTPDRKKPEYWDGGDVEWISLHDTQNLERCDISKTDMRITQAGLANSSARLLPPGTVCFSRTATVGKCVIMAKSMATSQDFANFICSPTLNNRYLLHLMRWMQPVWKALASGSTHKTIYMPTFKALQIILPSRNEQDSIAATMDGFVSVAEGHAASLTRLRSMKVAIMSDLLSGHVRVPA